jgi:hypothetical protein
MNVAVGIHPRVKWMDAYVDSDIGTASLTSAIMRLRKGLKSSTRHRPALDSSVT